MALSGTVKTSSYEGRYVQLDWTGEQFISENKTVISWTLSAVGGAVAWYAERTLKVTIGGSTAYSKTNYVERYSGVIATGTHTISHNDTTGAASFSIDIQAAIYYSAVNCTGNGTFTLDTIPRHPDVPTVTAPTTSTVSETTKSVTVKWAKSNRGTYTVEVSKNGGAYSSVEDGIALSTLSYTYTISPSQGDTYRFRVKAVYSGLSSDYSYSGTVTLNSLTAPTIGTLSTYNPYVTATLSVPLSGGSQANGGAFTRRADLYYGSTKLASCSTPSNDNTSVSISYAAANYASQLGTTKYSGTFKIVAWTQNSNGSKSTTVSKNFTVNLNSDGKAVPTLSNPTLSGGFTGYTSTCFVAGVHNLTVTSGSASANRAPSGTTLSYKIECTGFSSVDSSSATFTKPTAGKKTIKITVTDSRGLSTSKTIYCRFQSWTKPTVKITSAERDETTPSTINVVYTVSYTQIYDTYGTDGDTAGTNINTVYSQQYTTASTYTNCTSPISITGTNTELSYTVTVRASDKIATSTYGSASKFVGTVDKYVSFRDNSIGLGCVPNTTYRLDVKGKARFVDSGLELKIQNGTVYIPNGKYYYSYRADGTAHALLAMNSDNNVVLNYTGYNNEIGATNIYGNHLKLLSKNSITANTEILVNGYGSVIGAHRFNQTWMGFYPTYTDATNATNRNGYVGFSSSSSTTLQVVNEKATAISFKTYDADGNASGGATINHNALYPDSDNTRACGYSTYRWTTVYATSGVVNTSDRNHKKNIKELDDKYIQLFNKLIPVSFEFNYADSDRVHIGFISQDVEDAMDELGMTSLEFAGFCKDKQQVYNEDTETWEDVLDENGKPVYIYSLRYQEFIALNTLMIQKQQKEIEELKQMVKGGI